MEFRYLKIFKSQHDQIMDLVGVLKKTSQMHRLANIKAIDENGRAITGGILVEDFMVEQQNRIEEFWDIIHKILGGIISEAISLVEQDKKEPLDEDRIRNLEKANQRMGFLLQEAEGSNIPKDLKERIEMELYDN